MSIADEPIQSETKPCKVCAEPIKTAARICNQCKSYQDWRSYLSMSQSVLALAIALISVMTVFLPIAKSALTPVNSNLIFSRQSEEGLIKKVLVSNLGIRPGTVNDAYIFAYHPKGDTEFYTASLVNGNELIRPGESELLTFEFEDKYRINLGDDWVPSLVVMYTNFDGSKDQQTIAERFDPRK